MTAIPEDKLYWRDPRESDSRAGPWHCFARAIGGPGYVSLCGFYFRGVRGGQSIHRPVRDDRCPECNRLEMKRKQWDKPGPPTIRSWKTRQ